MYRSNDKTTRGRFATRGLAIVAVAAALAGCNTVRVTETPDAYPNDYRQRHPIAIKEGPTTLEVFVGVGRGGLTAVQRAEVLAFASSWQQDATGGITIDRPVSTPNERAAAVSLREVISLLVSAGVPNRGIGVRPYRPPPGVLGTIRINHPKMVATVGPCGLWPEDLGPTFQRAHFENRQYWNLGCASQRNLAAMVDNPADLVQPRSETASYTAKRVFGREKWRKGESPATIYPDPTKGAISDVGK